MKLSVMMITYNHAPFIREALDSVLMQEVDFDYEVVIGEDRSKDATREILVEYREKFPDRIRLLFREKNLGAVTNFYQTLGECRGRYVALLEGDDFWTDPLKLRMQVELLDGQPDYVSCFHDVIVRSEDGSRPEYRYVHNERRNDLDLADGATLQLADLLRSNVIPTCSCVFRRGLIDPLPAWAYQLKMADYPLHVLNAQHGKLCYIDRVMGVYRLHTGGVWRAMDSIAQAKVDLKFFEFLARGLQPQFRPAARRELAKRQWQLANDCERAGQRASARNYTFGSLVSDPLAPVPRFRSKLKRLVRLSIPFSGA